MYNHKEIEAHWQEYWETNKTFKVDNPTSAGGKPKYYVLDMFPYPSGAGLHVGHPKGFTANDAVARHKNAKGFNVLHPMGWDAFGLPAENFAIKTGTHPKITTNENITNFRRQIKSLGFSYDWDREVDTTDPAYYKWTQWIFLKLFEKGLAYEQDLPINYCPSCKTGLANEEVLSNFTCERCGEKVEKKKIRQWVLAITKYADRLAKDVDKLDWPKGIKDMQRNWIGRSEGCEFKMKIATPIPNPFPSKEKGSNETDSFSLGGKDAGKADRGIISVYTTRVDTVFGMTYAVLAPDHPKVNDFIKEEEKEACLKYINEANSKSDQDRTAENKEKTGVFTGSYLINPFNNEKVPLWIADYVLGNYGTGAVMAVPAHDERDLEFAKKYGLEIIESIGQKRTYDIGRKEEFQEYDFLKKYECFIKNGEIKEAFTNLGILVNSGDFTGLTSEEAKVKLTDLAEEKKFGTKKVNYKLRDWLFSRQRYWGEPIPLIHLKKEDLKQLTHIKNIKEATEENKAYILKRPPLEGEDYKGATCCCTGNVKELIIGGKVFSKIYDGIYGKMVCDYDLPLKLPEVENYEPAGDGNSPLIKIEDFVNIKLADNLNGKRETNTMPQWGGSCWYYLRFMDPHNDKAIVSEDIVKYWGEVDSYVGGAEHAVLHLLYARFWHKFLFDIGVVPTDEPFYKLRNQGMILSYSYRNKEGKLIASDLVDEKQGKYYDIETGEELEKIPAKMSKSLKNVVNPDDIVEEFGADTLRLYEMYIADFKDSAPWDTKAISGVKRFLDKVYNIFETPKYSKQDDEYTLKLLHKTIKKLGEDIGNYKFNTALSAMMILINNGLPKDEKLIKQWKETFLIILHPFAPHICEELWKQSGNKQSIFFASWPEYDENLVKDDVVTIGVQILGKLRGDITVQVSESKDVVLKRAKENEAVAKWLEGKEIIKEIYVTGKIVNLVVK